MVLLYSRAWRNNGQRSGHAGVLLCFKMTNQEVCSQPMFISQIELVQTDMWLTAEIVWVVLNAVSATEFISLFQGNRFYCDVVWQIETFKPYLLKDCVSWQRQTPSWLVLLTLTVYLCHIVFVSNSTETGGHSKQLAWLCPKLKYYNLSFILLLHG